MKFKLYYEKSIGEMIVDIVDDLDDPHASVLKRLQFKHVAVYCYDETHHYNEGHPKVAQVGVCAKLTIQSLNLLEIS